LTCINYEKSNNRYDGSFEVYMDGYYLENVTLPGVNTKQYLSKTAE